MLLSFNMVNVSIPTQIFLIVWFLRLLFVENGVFDIINFDYIYMYMFVSQFILCGVDLPSTSNNKFVKF